MHHIMAMKHTQRRLQLQSDDGYGLRLQWSLQKDCLQAGAAVLKGQVWERPPDDLRKVQLREPLQVTGLRTGLRKGVH